MWRRVLVGAMLPVLVAACAPAASQLDRVQFARNPSVRSRQEWTSASVTTAYDAVSRLRPDFFKRRGETSILFPGVTALNVCLTHGCDTTLPEKGLRFTVRRHDWPSCPRTVNPSSGV